jgi:hypothetical protein
VRLAGNSARITGNSVRLTFGTPRHLCGKIWVGPPGAEKGLTPTPLVGRTMHSGEGTSFSLKEDWGFHRPASVGEAVGAKVELITFAPRPTCGRCLGHASDSYRRPLGAYDYKAKIADVTELSASVQTRCCTCMCVCKVVRIALNTVENSPSPSFSTQSRKNPAGDGIRTHDLSIPGISLYC